MAYYDTCPDCGASLDPGENCACHEERAAEFSRLSKMLKEEASGQYSIAFDDHFGGSHYWMREGHEAASAKRAWNKSKQHAMHKARNEALALR